MNASKFLASVSKFRQEEQWFHMRLFGYLHIALEMDMLQKHQLKRIMVPGGSAPNGDEAADPLRRPLPEERALRQSCKNSVVLACAVFADSDNLVRQKIISRLAEPWREWFASQSSELRSCQASLDWELKQLRGDYMRRCQRTVQLLSSVDVPPGIGIRTVFLPNDAEVLLDDVVMQRENDFSWHAAQFTLGLVGARLRRGLELLRGWPQRAALMASEASGQQCMDMLKHDFELWQHMAATDHELLKSVVARSCFHTVLVQQLVAICKSQDWVWSPIIGSWVQQKHRRFRASQACEDAFKRQRRREARGQNRRGNPTRCFGVLLEREVLSKVHNYQEVDAKDCHLRHGSALPSDAFEYRQSTNLAYSSIISHSSSTSWYSPTAAGQATVHADHSLLMYLRRKNNPDLLKNTWLSCFLNVPNIMMRCKSEGGLEEPWVFPIAEVPGSAGLGWRATLVQGDGQSAGDMFTIECDRGGCIDITLLDVGEWEARLVEWRSPFWSWRTTPVEQRGVRSVRGALAEATTPPEPLLVAAAKSGFWRFDMVVRKKIAKLRGLDLDHCTGEFELCWQLLSVILDTADEDALLGYLHTHISAMRASSSAPKEFMEFEETEHLMCADDSDEFKKAQKLHKKRQVQLNDFLAPYKEKRQAVAKASAKAAAAAGRGRNGGRGRVGGRGGGRGGHPWGERAWPVLIIGETISQGEANTYLPPGCSIWESRSRLIGGWNGHFPRNPRISCSDIMVGSHAAAAHSIIRQLWEQYLDFQGMSHDCCPVPGLIAN